MKLSFMETGDFRNGAENADCRHKHNLKDDNELHQKLRVVIKLRNYQVISNIPLTKILSNYALIFKL